VIFPPPVDGASSITSSNVALDEHQKSAELGNQMQPRECTGAQIRSRLKPPPAPDAAASASFAFLLLHEARS